MNTIADTIQLIYYHCFRNVTDFDEYKMSLHATLEALLRIITDFGALIQGTHDRASKTIQMGAALCVLRLVQLENIGTFKTIYELVSSEIYKNLKTSLAPVTSYLLEIILFLNKTMSASIEPSDIDLTIQNVLKMLGDSSGRARKIAVDNLFLVVILYHEHLNQESLDAIVEGVMSVRADKDKTVRDSAMNCISALKKMLGEAQTNELLTKFKASIIPPSPKSSHQPTIKQHGSNRDTTSPLFPVPKPNRPTGGSELLKEDDPFRVTQSGMSFSMIARNEDSVYNISPKNMSKPVQLTKQQPRFVPNPDADPQLPHFHQEEQPETAPLANKKRSVRQLNEEFFKKTQPGVAIYVNFPVNQEDLDGSEAQQGNQHIDSRAIDEEPEQSEATDPQPADSEQKLKNIFAESSERHEQTAQGAASYTLRGDRHQQPRHTSQQSEETQEYRGQDRDLVDDGEFVGEQHEQSNEYRDVRPADLETSRDEEDKPHIQFVPRPKPISFQATADDFDGGLGSTPRLLNNNPPELDYVPSGSQQRYRGQGDPTRQIMKQ